MLEIGSKIRLSYYDYNLNKKYKSPLDRVITYEDIVISISDVFINLASFNRLQSFGYNKYYLYFYNSSEVSEVIVEELK